MKVVRLYAPGDLRLYEEPMPSRSDGEALLRVTAVGICGSDLHWFQQAGIGDARLVTPLTLGHEFAAIDERCGYHVAVEPSVSCGCCEFCLEGNPNLCPSVKFAGHGNVDGAMRQYLSWPEKNLFQLPENLSQIEGAMLEPLGVAIHAIDLAHLHLGMKVGVFGCGPIGLLIIQLARLAGVTKIIATDRLIHRVDAAHLLGADLVYQVDDDGNLPDLMGLIDQPGLDVVFEVAGENVAVENAISAAKPGGQVILVGIPSEDTTSFCASSARRKGLTLKLVRRMKNTYLRAIDLIVRGLIDVRSLVTHRFPLEQAQEAFLIALRRDGLKIILEP